MAKANQILYQCQSTTTSKNTIESVLTKYYLISSANLRAATISSYKKKNIIRYCYEMRGVEEPEGGGLESGVGRLVEVFWGKRLVNKISIFSVSIIMQQAVRSQVDMVNPLIKLVKEREDLYFQLLGFVNSHLTSSSNDLDNTTVFNKFIALIDSKHQLLHSRETQFLSTFSDPFAEPDEAPEDPISKQMLRLFSRLLQILQASIERVRGSVFEDNGKALKEFTRFKSTLNKIIKQEFFIPKDFVQRVVSYTTNKYSRQFLKLKKYVEKVKQGDDVWFRELYYLQKSDVQSSPSPDEKRPKEQGKTARRLIKKIDMEQHLSSTQEPEKKAISLKKTVKTSMKKREKPSSKTPAKPREEEESPTKQKTASKMYKLYSFLELSKKDFLEDYIYDKLEEEKHKNELLNKLMERNKTINSQISVYIKKSANFLPVPIFPVSAKSSGDERNESASSRVSLRASFVISKRKSSFHYQSSDRQSSVMKKSDNEGIGLERTIKNVNPRRRSSHSNQRIQQKSKKLFFVKPPMVFEQEIIPQAQITQTQWMQAPLTVKCKEKKTQNIRLKRKNNVNPLQNAFLPQNFRYPL